MGIKDDVLQRTGRAVGETLKVNARVREEFKISFGVCLVV